MSQVDRGEATPVVRIDVRGSSVLIDGVEVDNPDGSDPYWLGVRTTALEVARVLGRPVRARATDGSITTELVVHPDCTSELVSVTDARRPVPRSWLVAAAAALVLAVGGAGAYALGTGSEPAPRDTASAPAPAPTTTSPELRVVGGVTVLRAQPRRLRVRAAGVVGRLELTVSATRLPVRATVVVDPAGAGPAVRRTVLLRRPRTVVTVTDLPAGVTGWRVRVPEGPPATGATRVLEPPAPEPTYVPEPPPAPAPPPPPPPGPTAPYDPDEHS